MRIRLHGTEDECRRTADTLVTVLDVLDVSRPYPYRSQSRLVRLYLTAALPDATEEKPQ
ncbi:hypothetical protein LO771_10375 [Streptacidiphilus sp. ASG 303]|uniref:hypothetical protein n=1 Tax=Streptacidiphilus sp. ASG 303 TaxID=2896847 RepID=UPI001E618794|nr:hypothetical protein [Streptacidiphilus sp. ASG 303]MCD0482792.1 hypothetical protein [Streptacidiphilus sp. ASG 303]